MPAKDLGLKHTCFKCSAKFYDMKKPDPLCPKCGADQRDSPALKAPPAERRRPARPSIDVAKDDLDIEPALDEEIDEPGDDEDPLALEPDDE